MIKKLRKLDFAAKNAIAGYLFILPFIIGFLVFMFFPILQSLRMSFSDVGLDLQNNTYLMDFVWFANFEFIFGTNPDFTRELVSNLQSMAATVPAILVFSFFVALILNQKFKARGFVRSVFFLPVILSAGVMLGLETDNSLLAEMQTLISESNALASGITGVLEDIVIANFGGPLGYFLYWVLGIVNSIYQIALTSGIQIIIFLSGMQTISPSMYEASKIEGATAWESFWKITFPMISSLILVNVVYSVIDFFIRSDNVVMRMVTEEISSLYYGRGTAMAWSYFLIVIIIVGIISAIISKGVYYYE
jgi:ABC-type sugar transport system permease subunit